ncbi:MAG TPA: hypothetical protein VGM75_38900, partial [Pseudonocardiaceae bacterium]
ARTGADTATERRGGGVAGGNATGTVRGAATLGAGAGVGAGAPARLIPARRVEEYTARWNSVKGAFVDEPRQAVGQADQLVRELLNELHEVFGNQRHDFEHDLDAGEASTEDLRLTLGRYRSFFDRLLSM